MAGLAVLDLIMLAIAAVSVAVGVWRGFVREALSLVIWVAAFIMATVFGDPLAAALAEHIEVEALRFPVAFGALFLGTLILGSLISHLVGMLVEATGLTGLDRTLGTLFGLARAGVVGVVLVAVLDPMVGESTWWRASVIVPHLLAAQDATFEFFRSIGTALQQAAA